MILIFDASAVLAQAKEEPGAAIVESLLIDSAHHAQVHAVNLCEVYYHLLRQGGSSRADATLQDLGRLGVRLREDIDRAFWRSVGHVKAAIQQASLGDCFALALAQRVGGTVITADHPAFEQAATLGICPVTFIR